MDAFNSAIHPFDERLSWPSWLTCSGRFTHINGHPSAASQAYDRESTPTEDRRSANCATWYVCYVHCGPLLFYGSQWLAAEWAAVPLGHANQLPIRHCKALIVTSAIANVLTFAFTFSEWQFRTSSNSIQPGTRLVSIGLSYWCTLQATSFYYRMNCVIINLNICFYWLHF